MFPPEFTAENLTAGKFAAVAFEPQFRKERCHAPG